VNRDRDTLPPGPRDEAALAFGRRLSEVDARRRSLLREIAEAWAELTEQRSDNAAE